MVEPPLFSGFAAAMGKRVGLGIGREAKLPAKVMDQDEGIKHGACPVKNLFR